jgi:ribonuclease D
LAEEVSRPPGLIAGSAALDQFCRDLQREPVIALDTEGNSFHAYFDRVCLIQIGIPGREVLLDPLALQLEPLAPLLADPDRMLVVHGGDFDVRSLRRDFGFSFGRIFDTMLAAQTLGMKELSLAGLLKQRLGVDVEKGQQRSDWGRRPLRPEQLVYAAADVRFLLSLQSSLERDLVAAGKRSTAEVQFEKLRHLVARPKRFDAEGYLRLREARSLGEASRRVLKILWLGREALARSLDRPPFKVIGESVMLEVARRLPTTQEELRAIPGVSELVAGRLFGDIARARAAEGSGDAVAKVDG